MTPKEHFCHSRLVVPAQTSKAREGTHHLLVVRFLKEGSTGPPSPPPNSMVFSKPFGDPTSQTSPPCTRELFDQNHHKEPQVCCDRFMYVSCLSNTHVLCWGLRRIPPPPKKNTRWGTAGFSWGLPPLLPPHWKPKALAPLDCSPQRRRSMKMNQMAKMAGRHCEIIWNQRFSSWAQKTTWLKFCVKESNPTLPYSTKNCWSLKRCLRSRSPRPGFMGIPTKDAPGVSFTGSFVHFFGIGNTRSQGNIERVLRKDK